jgi:hypothetical protein
VAQRTGDTQGMNDGEGPPIACMGQHFPFQPVIIVTERVASYLRLRNHCIEVHAIGRYHTCAFFFIRTSHLILSSGSQGTPDVRNKYP